MFHTLRQPIESKLNNKVRTVAPNCFKIQIRVCVTVPLHSGLIRLKLMHSVSFIVAIASTGFIASSSLWSKMALTFG
jgi:hypothetical protein